MPLPSNCGCAADAVAPDLPPEAEEAAAGKEEPVYGTREYLTPPPTPLAAFLREGKVQSRVSDHTVAKVSAAEQLRVNCVPLEQAASWREAAGPEGSMHEPLAFECDGRSYPLVPRSCLEDKQGDDHNAYGRLMYHEQSPTLCNKVRPCEHRALVPFAPRVLSVREKARLHGFPDSFALRGSVQSKTSQVANAVSPSLAKGVARAILHAHAADHTQGSLLPSAELLFFAEFLVSLPSGEIPLVSLHEPRQLPLPNLRPMSLDEIDCAYGGVRFLHAKPLAGW